MIKGIIHERVFGEGFRFTKKVWFLCHLQQTETSKPKDFILISTDGSKILVVDFKELNSILIQWKFQDLYLS